MKTSLNRVLKIMFENQLDNPVSSPKYYTNKIFFLEAREYQTCLCDEKYKI